MSVSDSPCPRCSGQARWAGYSKRALRKMRPALDVLRCTVCGYAWHYARTGKILTARSYTLPSS